MRHVVTGVAVGGVAKVKLPANFGRAIVAGESTRVRINTPDHEEELSIDLEQRNADEYRMTFLGADGTPRTDDIRFEYIVEVQKNKDRKRSLFRDDFSRPPVPSTLFRLRTIGEFSILDLGFAPPGWSLDMIPEDSVEAHTRVSMDYQTLKKLRDAMNTHIERIEARRNATKTQKSGGVITHDEG